MGAKNLAINKRSGLRKLAQKEILFEDEAPADSLYIIQKGQIRLFKPKGKGFIEIAVLRPGEVVGEMAYFDDHKGRKRSCGAEAIVSSEVIEVSFAAFGKTIEGLNPWFKTIFTTLANRLRKANARVKSLESNNVSHAYGKEGADYKFFQSSEVIKILSVLFLVMSTHAEQDSKDGSSALHVKTINFYAQDIFNITEVKFIEFLNLLKETGLAFYSEDDEGLPKIFIVKDINAIRSLMVFFNTQRVAADDKKINMGERCLMFMERILRKADMNNLKKDIETIDVTDILEDFKQKNIGVDIRDTQDAIDCGFVGQAIIGGKGEISLPVQLSFLRRNILPIKTMHAIEKFNRSKQKGKYE